MWMQPVARPQSLSASATVYKTMLNCTKACGVTGYDGTKRVQTVLKQCYHANNTNEAYSTDTQYEYSNR